SSFTSDQNIGAGFGESTVENFQVVDKLNNTQAAKLTSLPQGVPATVDDSPTNEPPAACVSNATVKCDKLSGFWVLVDVANGATFGPAFQAKITYYSASGAPSYFVHIYTDATGSHQETILACGKKTITPPCFTWDNPTNTATIYTYHNGGYRKPA